MRRAPRSPYLLVRCRAVLLAGLGGMAWAAACSSGSGTGDNSVETTQTGGKAAENDSKVVVTPSGGRTGVAGESPVGPGGTNSLGGGGGRMTAIGGSDCGESTIDSSVRPVALLLAVDRSMSMSTPPSGDTTRSKWDILKERLVSSLDPLKDRLSLGLELFPYSDQVADPALDLTCQLDPPTVQVPVGAGAESLSAIATRLNATVPAGNTPTARALERALEYFTTGAGASLPGDRYVLLATDGGPNCNLAPDFDCGANTCIPTLEGVSCAGYETCCVPRPDLCLDTQSTIDALVALTSAGIRTFVVGIPGSEVYSQTLNYLAIAGDEPLGSDDSTIRYHKVNPDGDMQGLSDVITRITTELVTGCRLQLASQPPAITKINVYIDGTLVPQQGGNGWLIDQTTDPYTIELLGTTCERMQTVGAQHIAVQYGCPTVM